MRIYDGRDSFYQWDSNQKVIHNFKVGDEVHFFNMRQPTALTVRAYQLNNEVVADVPNILLQSSYPIYIYWMNLNDNGQFTKEEFTINVNQRPKPSGYVYTETEVLSYEYLDARISEIEQNGVSSEQISSAVGDYLEKNPITGGASPEEVALIHQNKQDIEKLSTDKLDADKLPNAVNEALAQAKASGAFDGKDYVLTEADKQEIAELVEIPEGGTVTDEQIASAVEDYMAENPVVPMATVEPAEDDIPKVFITGEKPTTKNDVLAEMRYISKTDRFHAYLTIKCQGTSSMSYAKKNFTVKLYSDEARETKLKKDFKDWGHPGNKFVLKSNWIDHSHARNIVSARLWGEVVASRPDYDSLPVELRNAPNNGAVDGFPVKVYYNGNYEGIYTWNIGKDDWMWGMDEDNPNHVLLCAEGNTDGVFAATTSNFRALWNGVDGQKPGWSVEVGTNSAALKTSLNNMIQFVIDNDGDAFRNGIGNYLDIQSAIDYYIFQYEVCGLDGLAHNMLLATYDGNIWHCGAYDLDATFGLWWNGANFVPATYACPEDYQERYSLLWERIEANFHEELKARQAELRKTVLSFSNMVTHFERFMDVIGSDLYAEDLTIYTAIPSADTNNIQQIRNYIRDRQAYVDAEFAAMNGVEEETVPCTGISLSASTLSFDSAGAKNLTATVTPDGCTDPIEWRSSNAMIATVNGGVVTPVVNGECEITAKCGEYSAVCAVSISGLAEVEYTKLNYIESSGTQFIDTGVTGGTTSSYEIKLNTLGVAATNYEQYFAGMKDNSPTAKMYCDSSTGRIVSKPNEGNYGSAIHALFNNENADHVVSIRENGEIYVDGALQAGSDYDRAFTDGWGDISWYVFNSHGEPALMASMRLYYLKMHTDGVLVRDFIPVIRNADGAIGLLDQVEGKFYGNSGTGVFAGA